MCRLPSIAAILSACLAACSPETQAPKAMSALAGLGFSEIAYESAIETPEGVVLRNVSGKDVTGKPFRAATLDNVRRGKDEAWASIQFEGYGDGDVASRSIRFADVAWDGKTSSNLAVLKGVTLKGRRFSYLAEQVVVQRKPSGLHVHATGLRISAPSDEGSPLSFPMELDAQISTSAGGVLRLDSFSATSEAFQARGTLTLAAPGLQLTGWESGRTVLGLDWLNRATLLDLIADVEIRRPFPGLPLPEPEGAARHGQGQSLSIRSTGSPIQIGGVLDTWKAAIGGEPSALAVTTQSTRRK